MKTGDEHVNGGRTWISGEKITFGDAAILDLCESADHVVAAAT